jgi:hypothetical protein
VTIAWAAATPDAVVEEGEALAEAELLEAAGLLEEAAAEVLELLLEEQAASSAAAVIAAAGAAKRFHVRVMLNIPPSTGHGLSVTVRLFSSLSPL